MKCASCGKDLEGRASVGELCVPCSERPAPKKKGRKDHEQPRVSGEDVEQGAK